MISGMDATVNNQGSPFDDLIDNVIISSPEGLITEINPAALNLLGCGHKADLLGRSMGKVCKDFSLEKITANLPLENCEMIYLGRWEKEIPMHVNITARRDGIIFSARDMSKTRTLIFELTQSRKKLESSYADLRASKDEVVRSEKLAFTGRIAASIAHEIRNPLTNVIMGIHQCAKAFKADDPKIKHVEIVLRNAERINYLITELLNCARPPKLDMRAHDIHKLLENVLAATKTKITSQKIKVVKSFSSKPAVISLDKEQIERAFLNIVINAVEAMPKAGQLTIMTEHDENIFVVKIQDTGKGIAKKHLEKIWDIFYQVDPKSVEAGEGIGLSLVKRIAEKHKGMAWVESEENIGTTFYVELQNRTFTEF